MSAAFDDVPDVKDSLSVAPTLVALPKGMDSYIATRERRVGKATGYACTTLRQNFERMLQGQTVRVGGRASCGHRIDPSWVEFCAWGEIVRKAKSAGLQIEATPVKHGNGWATKAGGFWDENDYRLALSRAEESPESAQGGEQGS